MTRFARSAPTNPAVIAAMCRRLIWSSSATFFAWTLRISSRPEMSGRSTTTWRSNRPGRTKAGSSVSGRFVAAMTITPEFAVEAVHLDEELVEGLVALVVAAAGRAVAAGLAQGVELVDEDQARGLRARPRRTGCAPAPRRRRRTSRRSPTRTARRTAPPPRPRRPGRAASCPCPAGRRAGHPWESARRGPGTSRASGGTRRPRAARSTASSLPATSAKVTRTSALPYSRCRLLANAMADPSPPPRCRSIQIKAQATPSITSGMPTACTSDGPGSASYAAPSTCLSSRPGSSASFSMPIRDARNRAGFSFESAAFSSPVSSDVPTRTVLISPRTRAFLNAP